MPEEIKEEVKEEVQPKAKHDIKEILELLDGLEVVVPAGVEIMADKELSMKDVKPLVEVVKKYEVIVSAVENIKGIIPEAKDLDTIELAQIGAKVMGIVKKAKAAYEKGK